MIFKSLAPILLFSFSVQAKTFQNTYVSFEVPDDWTCLQEGVAWTCTPTNAVKSKEAVIVLAAKVAGPEDNVNNFLAYLKQPKKIVTKVGTPVPSQVLYAQQRVLAANMWVQAQHLGSEIQDYYTLYLATVKEQLAILVSFSAEKTHYQTYNPVFDKAIKSLKIVANQQLLFPKKHMAAGDNIGIQGGAAGQTIASEDLLPPPEKRKSGTALYLILIAAAAAVGVAAFVLKSRKKPSSSSKKGPPRSK